MAGERQLPGLGLYGYWTAASDGWNTRNDENIRLVSAVVQLSALSRTDALPGVPTNGMIYIVPDGDSLAGIIAIRDNGAWVYIEPGEGWQAYIQDDDQFVYFHSGAWDTVPPPPVNAEDVSYTNGTGDADSNNTTVSGALDDLYGRVSAGISFEAQTANFTISADMHNTMQKCASVSTITVEIPPDASEDLPNGFSVSFIQLGVGQIQIDGGSVTLVHPTDMLGSSRTQYSVMTLTKSDVANTWYLFGDLEAA